MAWHAEESLTSCLAAVRQSAAAAGNQVEVVVVDNGPDDLASIHADVVIRNPVNAGYAVAVSQGAARASAGWLLLLNPDVVVDSAFVGALMEAAAGTPDSVAVLVPDLRFASDPAVVNCRGVVVDEAGIPAEIEAGEPATLVPARPSVFGGSGGACLLRAAALRRVGGVEPAYFAYLEDVDLAWRLQRAGYTALFVPEAVAYHEGSASVGGASALKAYLVARNRRLLFRLNGPSSIRARAWRAVVEPAHAAVTISSGIGLAPVRGRIAAFRLRAYTGFVLRSRAAIDPRVAEPDLAPRAGLRETLRRKRAVTGETSLGRELEPG